MAIESMSVAQPKILVEAEAYCRRLGFRFTEGRRQVLAVVARRGRAVKAYDLLTAVTRPGSKSMPPVVYRALDFWIAHGFVHKIESINSYIACGHPLRSHGCQLLVCNACGQVVEVCDADLRAGFVATATINGFSYERSVLEIYGKCPACRHLPTA